MEAEVITRLTSLRQHQTDGQRAPHKPLLVLLALGQLTATGSSSLEWSFVEEHLGALLAEFGRPVKSSSNRASYPFTHLPTDGVWELSRDVPFDKLGPLRAQPIEGHFPPEIESALLASPETLNTVARTLVEGQFPLTLAPDVLTAVGLDPDVIFGVPGIGPLRRSRKRDVNWRRSVIAAWDGSCAFCGFDGSIAGSPVGLEAAHVRWFNIGGPDDADNGLALCSLHHKLFDRGVLGLADPSTVVVSDTYRASSEPGKAIYELHDRKLRPRPGTALPAVTHVEWHTREVFKGLPLSA